MRKVYLFFALAIPIIVSAQLIKGTSTGHVTAYGLKISRTETDYRFSFVVNEAVLEAVIVLYNGDMQVTSLPVAVVKGSNTVVIPIADIPEEATNWGLHLVLTLLSVLVILKTLAIHAPSSVKSAPNSSQF